MRRLLIGISVAVSAFTLSPSSGAAPTPGFRLEAHVPPNAIAFASLEGIGTWGERFRQTALAKIGEDPEIQAFAKPILEDAMALFEGMAGQNMGEGAKQGIDLAEQLVEQLAGLRGQAAVAAFGDFEHPTVAASLDFGDHVSDFVTFLRRAQETVASTMGGSPFVAKEQGGRTWWHFGRPGDDPVAFATDVGSALVVSTDRAWLEGAVAPADDGRAAPTLASSSSFQETRLRSAAGEAGAWIFVNVKDIAARAPIDGSDRRIANALGLDTIHAAAYSVTFSGDGFLDTLVLHAPGADHGIVPILRTKPTTHPVLPLVPKNAFYYSEANGPSLSQLLPRVREIVSKVEPRAVEQLEGFLAQARRVLGVDVEKDLLAGLTDESASYVSLPDTGGVYPELAIFLGVKDAAAFESSFAKALDGAAGAITEEGDVVASTRTIEYRGQRLHLFEMHAARGDDPVPFTPTWAILGGRLVVTLVPHTMKELVLRSQESKTGGGLGDEEDFRALLRVAPEGHGTVTYYDTQALFALLYDTGVPLLQTLVKKNMLREVPVRLDWAQLPATRTIRPHLRSVATTFTGDESGARITVHSPIPAMGLVMVGASAAATFTGVRRPFRDPPGREATREIGEPEKPPTEPVPMPPIDAASDAQAALDVLAKKVIAHGKAMGSLPASLEDLVGPGKSLADLPRDPFGTPIRYKAADRVEGVFELRSAGPNRTFGDLDDVLKQYETD